MTTPNENQDQITPRETKIRDLITSPRFKGAVAAALPAHLRPDRFVRVALTAVTRTPRLAECDEASFFNCLLTLSQLGLEPDGRNAHLIPFRNSRRNVTECQLIIDYKGLVDLAMRSGRASFIHADKVCDKDIFEYDRGEIKAHKINFREPRGRPYAYYSFVRFKDGTEKSEVMAVEDIEVIRARSRAGNDGPWKTDFDEMAKKTVFRRLSKWLQLSPEYLDALEHDADRAEDIRFAAAVPIERAAIAPTRNLLAALPVRHDAAPPQLTPAEERAERKRLREERRQRKEKQLRVTPEVDLSTGEIKTPFPGEGPKHDEITKLLVAAHATWDDLRDAAIKNKWVSPLSFDGTFDEDKCAALLENWGMVAEGIDELKTEAQPSTPAAEQTKGDPIKGSDDALFQ